MSQIFLSSTLKKFLETIFIDSTKIYLLEKSLEPIEIGIFLIIIISRNQNLFPSLISSYFNQKSLEFSRLKFQDPSSNLLHFYLHHIINIYIYINLRILSIRSRKQVVHSSNRKPVELRTNSPFPSLCSYRARNRRIPKET